MKSHIKLTTVTLVRGIDRHEPCIINHNSYDFLQEDGDVFAYNLATGGKMKVKESIEDITHRIELAESDQ
jgi:hypothetical protein